jgi:uncharacterized phage protein (TIGR02218 family)
MTSLDTLEGSLQSSEPIEVYRIVFGSTVYRYTSSQTSVVLDGETYLPQPISRGRLSQNRERQPQTLDITVPGTLEFPRNYLNIAPGRIASVSIIRLQRNESPTFDTQLLIFKGTIGAVNYSDDGRFAKLIARSIEYSKAESVPRFTFMGMCNNFLYDPFCKVNPDLYNEIGTCSAGGTTTVLTVPNAANRADGFFNGGYITPTSGLTDFRMVLAHTGDQITILLPFAEDVTGAEVQIFSGCDHILTGDCATKFDNVENFGGFHFVPNKNIFSTGL